MAIAVSFVFRNLVVLIFLCGCSNSNGSFNSDGFEGGGAGGGSGDRLRDSCGGGVGCRCDANRCRGTVLGNVGKAS